MTDLAAFLAARLDEDEQLARTADAEPFPDKGFPRGTHIAYGLQSTGIGLEYQGFALVWDPARVLAEVTAKRGRLREFGTWQRKLDEVEASPDRFGPGNRGEIIGMWMMARRAVLYDAAVWSGHEDFDESWRT